MHEIEIIIDIKFQPAKPKGSSIQEKMFRYVSKVQNIKPHPMAPNRSGVQRLTIARKLWKKIHDYLIVTEINSKLGQRLEPYCLSSVDDEI